mmetsp:Transcript_1164/g.4049  ORF Transcript_1164/g.4049 Transcript_1164/m.4049 type:complete len:105 (+) Transcript_1164:445-759(+)
MDGTQSSLDEFDQLDLTMKQDDGPQTEQTGPAIDLDSTINSNFVDSLGLSSPKSAREVPQKDIRKAYLDLARQYHPDKGGDQDMFVVLQSAYELLQSDADCRPA